MDTKQPTYAFTPPALDPFGVPHFTGDDRPPDSHAVWLGDPSSVPLPGEADPGAQLERVGTELDRTIFASLIAP